MFQSRRAFFSLRCPASAEGHLSDTFTSCVMGYNELMVEVAEPNAAVELVKVGLLV
jgi:hypothetical protein